MIYDFLDEINKEKLIEFIVNLQQQDGSFSGDKWGSLFFLIKANNEKFILF